MPLQYTTSLLDEMVRRILTGESVSDLVLESGVPMQTLHRWKHHSLIDAGLVKGVDSAESAARRAAYHEIGVCRQSRQDLENGTP